MNGCSHGSSGNGFYRRSAGRGERAQGSKRTFRLHIYLFRQSVPLLALSQHSCLILIIAFLALLFPGSSGRVKAETSCAAAPIPTTCVATPPANGQAISPASDGLTLAVTDHASPASSADVLPLVEKQRFRLAGFRFENDERPIDLELGYETYGQLNPNKDNAVLVCHYFTGHSHAAGRYAADDPTPGWWDALIGPGKVIDTKRWFVVCVDSIANINARNPKVVTTGPATINPATGRPYGMSFPIFTIADLVRTQKLLLDQLGITRLRLVIGPSMGGLQAWMWGRLYPKMVDRLVAVFATPMMRPWGLMMPNQLGIDAIKLDPRWKNGDYYDGEPPLQGLLQAFKILLMVTRTDTWMERQYGRRLATDTADPYRSHDGRFLVDQGVESIVRGRMTFFDPNHYLYIAKANTLFDLRQKGETFEQALAAITPPSLMIIDESDLLFTRAQAEEALRFLPRGRLFCFDSTNGHLSCLYETDYYKDALRDFLVETEAP